MWVWLDGCKYNCVGVGVIAWVKMSVWVGQPRLILHACVCLRVCVWVCVWGVGVGVIVWECVGVILWVSVCVYVCVCACVCGGCDCVEVCGCDSVGEDNKYNVWV